MIDKMSHPHVVAIIQARMGSTRLPGKTLADVHGKPLLAHVIERVNASQAIRSIMIATTTQPIDLQISAMATQCGVGSYAGSVSDVLDRYYQVGMLVSADVIVRITADDPFKDPQVIDKVVRYFLDHPGLDYASNTIEPSYPEGLDVEVFSFGALQRAWREAKLPSEREHVTPYVWENPNEFNVANIKHHEDLSHLRWTIDYEEDLRFAREVYARLHHGQVFLMEEILALLRQEPELERINEGVQRNEGYLRTLKREKGYSDT